MVNSKMAPDRDLEQAVKVLPIIDEIVDEIDLLVLNTKIEAAQAAQDKIRTAAGKAHVSSTEQLDMIEELPGIER